MRKNTFFFQKIIKNTTVLQNNFHVFNDISYQNMLFLQLCVRFIP